MPYLTLPTTLVRASYLQGETEVAVDGKARYWLSTAPARRLMRPPVE
jgi:hypothetical protein